MIFENGGAFAGAAGALPISAFAGHLLHFFPSDKAAGQTDFDPAAG